MRISASFYGKLLLRLTLNFVLLGVLAVAVLPEQLAMIDWATSLSGGRSLLLFVVAAGGSALLWYFFARQVAGAIGTLSDATEQIADGSFDVRAETGRADELGRLGDAISRMAARLEGYVNGQKRFLGDTAHELCSPLARMQMAVGIIEGNARPEQKEYIADIADEVRHMSDLVNELLSFSKASLQPGEVKIQTIRLAPIVEMAVKRESTGKADVTVSVPAELEVRANTQLLARAIGNRPDFRSILPPGRLAHLDHRGGGPGHGHRQDLRRNLRRQGGLQTPPIAGAEGDHPAGHGQRRRRYFRHGRRDGRRRKLLTCRISTRRLISPSPCSSFTKNACS
jgi:HAMP domain-containing protein